MRAEVYAAKGERKRAMADINRALKFTWDADFLKVRGELRLDDGDIDGALHDADAMLKLDADNAAALALRGAAFARKKDYDRALADLDKAIKADGNDALAYGERGQIYLAKNDSDRALADFNRAIELGTISAGALSRARHDLQEQGRYRQGDQRSRSGDPARSAAGGPYFERAGLRKAKGETAQALADLNDGLARKPDNVAGLMARAQIKQAQGRRRRRPSPTTTPCSSATRRMSPRCNARAMALMQTKSYAKAADDFDRVIAARSEERAGLLPARAGARTGSSSSTRRSPTTSWRSRATAI